MSSPFISTQPTDGGLGGLGGRSPPTTPTGVRLAVVEIQLIMQHLDIRSLLALGRCNRLLLNAASTDFACKGRLVRIDVGVDGSHHDPGASRILRHCDTEVHWPCSSTCNKHICDRGEYDDDVFQRIQSIPRIRTLTRIYHIYRRTWIKVLSTPAFSHVTHLYGTLKCFSVGADDPPILQRVAHHMPNLRVLHINCNASTNLALLARMCYLHTLTIHGASENASLGVDGFPSLRVLRLIRCQQSAAENILLCPMARSLTFLHYLPTRSRSNTPWDAILANLHSLKTLSLRNSLDISLVIRALAAAPNSMPRLQRLRVSVCFDMDTLHAPPWPEIDQLVPLLTAKPMVSIQLYPPVYFIESMMQKTDMYYAPLANAFPSRVTFSRVAPSDDDVE
jgi:hypothetical protein